MNERDLHLRLLRQFPSSAQAFLQLRWQDLLRIERPQVMFSSEELQKLLLQAVMKSNEAAERNTHQQRRLEDPQAICLSTISRARDTSAVAIQLARRVEPAPATRMNPGRGFGAVMSRFPWIARWAVSERRRMLATGSLRHLRLLHHYTLDSLAKEGLGCDEYPFSSHSHGYRAFCDWLRRELRRGMT